MEKTQRSEKRVIRSVAQFRRVFFPDFALQRQNDELAEARGKGTGAVRELLAVVDKQLRASKQDDKK